jgi:predicted O-methyltransferase YrrM
MATDAAWHDRITASIGGAERYGTGCWPNPYFLQMAAHERRGRMAPIITNITHKIAMLSEPRFHCGSETSELMESLIAMICAKQVLELGTHTARSTLHFLRAIVGIPGAKVVSIDARPTHDREFFAQPGIAEHFEFIQGWTPEALGRLRACSFDFVFVDSAHDLAHTQRELEGLQPIIHSGTLVAFHDVPRWRTPSIREEPEVRVWLREQIKSGAYDGLILPSPRQLDCIEEYGDPNYPIECSPGLAVLIRK